MIHTNCFTDILSGEGGSVSAESETVNLSEGGQAAGAQAAAYDGYVFTNWTAADGTVVSSMQDEQEIGSWEPIPEEPQQEAPAPEPVQEEAPAVEAPAAEPAAAEAPAAPAVEAPAETAAPAAQTIDNAAVPAADPSAALAAGMQAVPAADGTLAEGTALTDAEEVIVPSETTGETAVQDGLITVIYASGEGGSVSAESETVNFSEGGQAAGAQAAAYDG